MLEGSYDPSEVEPRWQRRWLDAEVYAYDPAAGTGTVAIDSPPPTVSGSLHMGHFYGFTLQDFAARFARMRGRSVYFPFGYDDNGIASERLTEAHHDIAHQDYDRGAFQQLTREVCDRFEAEFTDEMRQLGISIDWSQTYQTISPTVQRLSQLSFIDLTERDRQYRKEAPAIWCPECETAISQVETEDAERASHFNDITFAVTSTDAVEAVEIATTRPELLPACVALFIHPDDERVDTLVGEEVAVPIFGHTVPILADDRVDAETGTGVVMCCTFGDQTDIEWYQAHDLPLRLAIDESGTLTDVAEGYAGLSAEAAREAIVADLEAAGALADRRPITHTVNVHERCGTGIEFLVKAQWYIRVLDRTDAYLEAGAAMEWVPEKMFTRYRNWIEGLQWDWAISRQRSSGIPIPVWYCDGCDAPVLADRTQLPVDPLTDAPPVDACPDCGASSFTPEGDVLDTWATSSLTPLINAGWDWDADAAAFTMARPELYPFTLRPQGHDIISFWLFHTVVKCLEHTGEVPFERVLINGMVLDADRQKMSKSKGNVVSPEDVLERYPVDAARYWAASSAVGDDIPYAEEGLRAGEKLIQKLWNASRLVDALTAEVDTDVPHEALRPIDRWLLAALDAEIERLTDRMERFAFSKARDGLRSFFWHTFCDDYLEIAKQRIREEGDAAAATTVRIAHERFLRLFAPFLAHITEELYHAMVAPDPSASIHHTSWPTPLGVDADIPAGETAMAVVGALRKYKSDAQLPMNAPLARVEVTAPVGAYREDIARVMHVEALQLRDTAPTVTERITGIDLAYGAVGPAFGAQVPEIEAAIDAGAYTLDEAGLHLAGVDLDPEMYTVERERTYDGDGELIDAGGYACIVHR